MARPQLVAVALENAERLTALAEGDAPHPHDGRRQTAEWYAHQAWQACSWRRAKSRTIWQLLPPCTTNPVHASETRAAARARDASLETRGRAGVTQSGGPIGRHGVGLVQSCTLTPERDSRTRVDHSCTLTDPAHDIWHRRHTAWQVFCWLISNPTAEATAAEIARDVGVHASTAGRNLAWLATLGLAERGFAGWLLPALLPEDVPAESWAEKRRARHGAERAQHAQSIEERAKRRRS